LTVGGSIVVTDGCDGKVVHSVNMVMVSLLHMLARHSTIPST